MTTEMHKAPSVAQNTGTSGDNATSVARYDLSTSEGGRRYVADFFARELRRHDFARYITTTLAADFACALAQHLAATGKQQGGEVQGDARAQFEAWHCEKFKTRWQTGAPTRDMHNGVHAEKYGPAEQQVRWEDWQAAWQAALAARQPGAQLPVASIDPRHLFLMAGKDGTLSGNVLRFGASMQPGDAPLYAAPPAQGIDLGPGVQAIAIERQRQMAAERFTSTHDEQYQRGELAKAAVAYAQLAAMELDAGTRGHIGWLNPPAIWPWEAHWWKPVDARRDLVRAGALIAAQLDLIDQRDAAPGVGNG
ncbi:TPA: hypothetical protein UL761_000308 [Stenotrophomonas maltophilia]|uniref:hypothetical protein n=1 Tax=Stenotrophomonas bentonitica TaxID=1450134 RepID=UPI000C9AF58E|nr:hypothetical protein [Stenotrophomonas bentonitica]HEL7748804.1 hypothetical protein [Stenotrophomonas maltophilia]